MDYTKDRDAMLKALNKDITALEAVRKHIEGADKPGRASEWFDVAARLRNAGVSAQYIGLDASKIAGNINNGKY